MQAQCAKVKENIQKRVQSLKPAYAISLFIEYLCKDLAVSKNPMMEGSKIMKEVNSDLEKRWQEFRKSSPVYQKEKIRELLLKNYLVYSRTEHYREYLFESLTTSRNPYERFLKIEDELERGERKPPFEWRMSLEKKLDPTLLERLERVRNDKFFPEYVDIRTRWLERFKDKKPEGTDKEIEGQKRIIEYLETLPKLQEWIMDQRFFNFTNEKIEYYFRHLEGDMNDLKRRKIEQQRQMQSQGQTGIAPAVPQYSHQQMANQHQNQQSYQHPQQRPQMNIQPNQQQMLHQQQQHQQQYVNHTQQNTQYTQDQNNQHYLNNRSHHNDPHTGNQPSSYRSSYPAAGNNQADNSHINNQYMHTYNEKDTFSSNYSVSTQDSYDSYSNQYQRPQQSTYPPQVNNQQQFGYNQQIKHEEKVEWSSFSGPDSTHSNNQHQDTSNFFSNSTHNHSTSQNQSHGQTDFQTGNTFAPPFQQDFNDFFSHQDDTDSYVADGKRARGDDYGDFGNMNHYNLDSHSDFSKKDNFQTQDYLNTSKKVKTNPSPQQELNMARSKSNMLLNTFTPSTMEDGSPQAKPNAVDLGQVRKDSRFHILEEQIYNGYADVMINRNDSGTMSVYEKIVLRIFQDGSKKIEIIDMANYDEFYKDFGADLIPSLNSGQLENVLDLWLKFLDICAMRADSKLKEWEDIF